MPVDIKTQTNISLVVLLDVTDFYLLEHRVGGDYPGELDNFKKQVSSSPLLLWNNGTPSITEDYLPCARIV